MSTARQRNAQRSRFSLVHAGEKAGSRAACRPLAASLVRCPEIRAACRWYSSTVCVGRTSPHYTRTS